MTETAEFTRDFSFETGRANPAGRPKRPMARFYHEPRKCHDGVFRDVEMVEFTTPGDKFAVCNKKVTDAIRDEFYDVYERWKRTHDVVVDGTPLEAWPAVGRSEVMNLRAYNVLTVEQVAELSDAQVMNLGTGMRTLQKQAQAWLAAKEQSDAQDALIKEKQALQDEVALMRHQMAEMAKRFDEETPKRGPGRPPKQENAT